jgi:hypothetical protein
MSKKTIGYTLIILGVVIAAGSLAADALGIGSSSGIGWHQWLGAAIGVIAAFAGVWLALRKPG